MYFLYTYCQEFGASYTRGEVVPGISYFTVDKKEINKGDSIKFEWEVYDATKAELTIKGSAKILNADTSELTSSVTLSPDTDNTYLLTVTNNTKSVSKEISIIVN